MQTAVEHIDKVLYKCRFIVVGILLAVVVFLVAVLVSSIGVDAHPSVTPATDNSPVPSLSLGLSDSSNAVTVGLGSAIDQTAASMHSFTMTVSNGLHNFGTTAASSSRAVVHSGAAVGHAFGSGVSAIGHGIGAGAMAIGHGVASGVVFVISIPGNIFGAVAQTPVVSAAIQPASHQPVPTIDDAEPLSLAAAAAVAAKTAPQPADPAPAPDQAPQWPIHGAITTLFGASDWPYQLHHTGIDISDGQRSGVTPVHPFKPGRVISVIHSSVSYGNHVIIDHGNGMTSLYGHMYSINVSEGQMVDKNTVLGTEGTTGASTGPHVHFEIRINNQPVNPQLYIQGNP